MKTATLPSLLVELPLRDAAQSVRAAFVARGLASREVAHTTGVYCAAGDVHAELSRMLQQTCSKVRKQ